MKDSRYILPSNSFNTPHKAELWSRFVMQLKHTEHKADTDLMDAVFDYTNIIKLIQQNEKKTDEEKNKAIRRNQKDKPRDKKLLDSFFNDAKQLGIIESYGTRTMKNGKTEHYWKHLKKTE